MRYFKVWFKQHGYETDGVRDTVLPAKSKRQVKFVVQAAYPDAHSIKIADVTEVR